MPWNSRIVIEYINRHKTDLAFCTHVGSAMGNEYASWESNKMNYPNIIALPVNHLSFLVAMELCYNSLGKLYTVLIKDITC